MKTEIINSEKIEALVNFLQIDSSDIIKKSGCYMADGGEYIVLENDEADESYKEYIESYIEECVLPEIPEYYRQYFDK